MSHSSGDQVHPQSGSQTHAAPRTSADRQKASAEQPQTSVHPVEPQDPKASGSSRATQNDALGVNVDDRNKASAGHPGRQAEEHPATPAGQHATGSFTGKKTRRSA